MVAHGQVVTLRYRGNTKVVGRIIIDRETRDAIYAWPEWFEKTGYFTLSAPALKFAKFAWEVREGV